MSLKNEVRKFKKYDDRIQYRGKEASRIDNLTDAVFGIAITLLIFNLTNPNSFESLLNFTKTLPAFFISIGFLILVWYEHLQFSEIYSFFSARLVFLNTIFIALIIFYVYPLRFLTLYLTNVFFGTEIAISIQPTQVPYLMIYYGFIAFALYFTLFLFYQTALKQKEKLALNDYELFLTKQTRSRLIIMFGVPMLSIILTAILSNFSIVLASMIGGFVYGIYSPLIFFWSKQYNKKSKQFENE